MKKDSKLSKHTDPHTVSDVSLDVEANKEDQEVTQDCPVDEIVEEAVDVSEPTPEQLELIQLQQSLDTLQDQHLRMLAEYDNYRKRTLQEKSELIKNGGERVLKDLLPIVDDFDLAVKHIHQKECEVDPMVEGLLLIYNKLMSYLERQGVVVIESVGKPFDDNLHEAVAMIPVSTPDQKGQVIDCVRTGYKLHDKVLRHAHVVVGN